MGRLLQFALNPNEGPLSGAAALIANGRTWVVSGH